MLQQTKEWHELRKTKIGASDAPVIVGVNPWKTSYQLWEEKLGLRQPKAKTAAMERGLLMEEEARQEFMKHTGIEVAPKVLVSEDIPWMMASLDGISTDGKHLVEIKCPGNDDHQLALDGVIPEKYKPQLIHQMIVANVETIFYFSYTLWI